MIPQGMVCSCTVAETIAAAVPHHVLPQLLRPMVTAMVPADEVLRSMTTLHDARGYASSVMVWPPSPEDAAAIVDCFDALRSFPKCKALSVRVEAPSLPFIARELASVIQVTSLCLSCPTTLDTALPEVSTCDGDRATTTPPGLLPRSFASLGNLTTLRIGRCGPADAAFCESVGKLRKLTSLSLCQADTIDAAAFGAHIAPLPITSLSLIHCTKVGPSFYEPSRIGHMSKLRTLSLEGCRSLVWRLYYLTDTPVCHTLTSLDLSGRYKVEDVTFDTVGTMTNLRALSLRHCDFIRDDDFESLHRLVHLEELDMGMWEWSDADTIHAVAQAFPALRRLNLLSNLTLRDDAVAALASIQSLEWVNLRNCSDVTEAAVSALRMRKTQLIVEK